MSDTLEEHDRKVTTGGRTIANLRLADDIYVLAEEEQEVEALLERLDKTCTKYKMDTGANKTKLLKNSASSVHSEINVDEQKLEMVTSCKHLGAIFSRLKRS